MATVQVIERGEGIEGAIMKIAKRRAVPTDRNGVAVPDLLVVSPGAVIGRTKLPRSCHTALLPGWLDERAPFCAASAVSYGLDPRDSLTVSSRAGGLLWVALQRELVTVEGRVLERQEFPVRLSREELSTLAVAGALILLGVPPEALKE